VEQVKFLSFDEKGISYLFYLFLGLGGQAQMAQIRLGQKFAYASSKGQ